MASMPGSLLGFVHNPERIIQHREGLCLGEYGAITFDPDVMPRNLTKLTVSVSRNAELNPLRTRNLQPELVHFNIKCKFLF